MRIWHPLMSIWHGMYSLGLRALNYIGTRLDISNKVEIIRDVNNLRYHLSQHSGS